MSRNALLCLVALFVLQVCSPWAVDAQEEESPKDPITLVLIAEDLRDATNLMTVYDLDEDGFVDNGEMSRIPWRDDAKDFDFNRDGKLSHLEFAVHQAKLRDDVGITALDVNSAKTKLRRFDKNKNGQLDEEEIERGWPNGPPDDYDRNHDGIVTLGELTRHFAFARGLRRELGIEGVDHSGAGRLIQKFDTNKDGELDDEETAKTYLPSRLADFDEDSNGKLTIVELETMLSKHRRQLGLTISDQQKINSLFSRQDWNADGRIEAREGAGFEATRSPEMTDYDTDKDGVVTRKEVEIAIAEQRKEKGYEDQDYRKAQAMFRRHDTNRSNAIEATELFSPAKPGQLPRTLMNLSDFDRDGSISKDELAKHYARQRG